MKKLILVLASFLSACDSSTLETDVASQLIIDVENSTEMAQLGGIKIKEAYNIKISEALISKGGSAPEGAPVYTVKACLKLQSGEQLIDPCTKGIESVYYIFKDSFGDWKAVYSKNFR